MPKPRLSEKEFLRIQKVINGSTDGLSKQELEKRRDYFSDLADREMDESNRSKYLRGADNFDQEIKKRFPTA